METKTLADLIARSSETSEVARRNVMILQKRMCSNQLTEGVTGDCPGKRTENRRVPQKKVQIWTNRSVHINLRKMSWGKKSIRSQEARGFREGQLTEHVQVKKNIQ